MIFDLIFTAIGGYINQHRGGGPFRVNNFLKDKFGFDLGRSLFTASLKTLGLCTLIWGIQTALVVAIGYLIWGVKGWGSYFDSGNWEKEFEDDREDPAIDWLLHKLFGPKWIPADSNVEPREGGWKLNGLLSPIPFSLGFLAPDLIKSPTGEIRPKSWRRKRDITGMTLRMLHSVYLFGGLAWLVGNPLVILWTIPFAIGASAIYAITNTDLFKGLPFIGKVFFEENKYLTTRLVPTFFAEVGVGLLLFAILLAIL